MRIQHNIVALNTNRNLSINNKDANKTLEKLSSGYKINRAGDDAAGLAISEKMRGQIRGLEMAQKNAQDGISLIQTAEGAMNEIHSMLQRVRELAVQAANDTNTGNDREKLQQEVNEIFKEIDAITQRTEFNSMQLLRGGGSINPRGPGGGGGGSAGAMLSGQALKDAQTAFTKRLLESTIETAEDMLFDDYGLKVTGKTMDISYITDSPGGMVARVWTSSNPRMEIDNADFFTEGDLWIDEDRIIAHEMVHAVMAGSGINMRSMPDWFVEGSAEFLPGAKERLRGSVNMLGADKVAAMLDSSTGGSHFYSAGYAATIYLDQKIRQNGHTDGLKSLLVDMQTTPTLTFEQAVINKIGLNLSSFKADFKASGTSLIENVVNNSGVGAISEITGLDGNGNIVFGNNKTNESIVKDDSNAPDSDGFTYIFADNMHEADARALPSISNSPLATISDGGLMKLHVGANEGQSIEVIMPTITIDALGLGDVDIQILADYSITLVDYAIEAVSEERSKLGAVQNRLEHIVNNLANTAENLTAAESRVRDADMAKEMMNFTKQNILMQATQSMLSQANQQPQGLLQLLN